MEYLCEKSGTNCKELNCVSKGACNSVERADLVWWHLHGLPLNPEVCQRNVCNASESCSVSPVWKAFPCHQLGDTRLLPPTVSGGWQVAATQ